MGAPNAQSIDTHGTIRRVSSPKHELRETDGAGAVPYIPLSEDDTAADNQSVGALVRDATQQVSTLVRAEIELAKSELTGEVRKGVKGSLFFIVALVVLLYSSFFFFFFLGWLIDIWLPTWASWLIVFGLMVLVAALSALLGYLKVKKLRKPERTIDSVKETAAAFRPQRDSDGAVQQRGVQGTEATRSTSS